MNEKEEKVLKILKLGCLHGYAVLQTGYCYIHLNTDGLTQADLDLVGEVLFEK